MLSHDPPLYSLMLFKSSCCYVLCIESSHLLGNQDNQLAMYILSFSYTDVTLDHLQPTVSVTPYWLYMQACTSSTITLLEQTYIIAYNYYVIVVSHFLVCSHLMS